SYHPVDIICSLLVEENIIAGMAGKDLNIMTVVAERSFPNRPDLKETTKYFRDRIYKSANVCVFQTEEQRDCFSHLNLKNMVVIPNPIMEGLPMPYNGEREKTIVTYCGLREAKNLPLLIKAFAMIHTNFPDYNLKIYGNGELKGTLEQLIVELNLENFVDIFPFVKEIHQEVRKDALFVLSSDFEGMPNALLEAMAIGMPVIATDCLGGGAKAVIVHKENGLIVPRGDEKALADAIAYMLSHPIESAAMGQNASKIREILKPECIAQKWINVFEERNILNGRAEV
ncbi:MAG: glycosyltransferase, partial [Tannerellaceae bacterium]|nr:glycosyltransferase [Tannerellaceae bacterium]